MNTNDSPDRPKVALIAGPTASGKSALALALAKKANGVIINADASQVYRDLRVLSARPSEAEEAQAEHRLFGTIDGAVACSAADWAALARGEIEAAHASGRLPILVGGTGLYLRTLLDGIAPIPPIDPAIREEVRARSSPENYADLTALDAEMAERLHPSDTTRVARALEVIRSTGRSIRVWQAATQGGIADRVSLRGGVLLPPRDWLYDRCDTRFEAMLASGAVEEVEALLARNLDPTLPVMRAIGVPEVAGWLCGNLSRDDMITQASMATRHYAKRQFTWFRNQSPHSWTQVQRQLDDSLIDEIVIKLLI